MIFNPSAAVYLSVVFSLCVAETHLSLGSDEILGKESNVSNGAPSAAYVFLAALAPPTLRTLGGDADKKSESRESPETLSDDAMVRMERDLEERMTAYTEELEAFEKDKQESADRMAKLDTERAEFDAKKIEDEREMTAESEKVKMEIEALEQKLKDMLRDFQKDEEEYEKDEVTVKSEETALSEEEKQLSQKTEELERKENELKEDMESLKNKESNLENERKILEEYEKELQKPHGTCIEVPEVIKDFLTDIGVYQETMRFCYSGELSSP